MKINLGNKILNIQLRAFKEPNFRRLEKELTEYFENNKVEGRKIKEFKIDKRNKEIIPINPEIKSCLLGYLDNDKKYEKDLEEIGNKYGVSHLGFPIWCYGR